MVQNNQDPVSSGEVIIYQTEDGLTRLSVSMENETVWLTAEQMSRLFDKAISTIREHIGHIFTEGELIEAECVRKIGISDYSTKPTNLYNLDVIISIGYRVKSKRGTQFRIWANKVLKEYLIKGFAMDDERLKGNGGGDYWKELFERIKDIRSSEKLMYRQVLDLYATAIDYDPKAKESRKFFAIVQNKLHYATHGHTAAELINERVDASKKNVGMTNFHGEYPTIKDVEVAKNYLSETELKVLNNLVSGYFDFAEISAIEHKPMRMADYIERLDKILSTSNRELLDGSGKIAHEKAIEKARAEYRKYELENLSPVEQAYFDELKTAAKIAKKKSK